MSNLENTLKAFTRVGLEDLMLRLTNDKASLSQALQESQDQLAAVTQQRDAARRCAALWKDSAKDWRHEAKRLEAELTTAELELPVLSEQLDGAIVQRDALREALEEVEFVDAEYAAMQVLTCPWCGGIAGEGHNSNCQRQAALKVNSK